MASVHEGKKNFMCDTCNASFSQKMDGTHMWKKINLLNALFAYKHHIKGHIASVHEG